MSGSLSNLRDGSLMPELIFSRLLNGKEIDKQIEFDKLKFDILEYIQDIGEDVSLSDLCEHFNKEPSIIVSAIKELKSEGRILQDE